MSHVERVPGKTPGTSFDMERCPCSEKNCQEVVVSGGVRLDRRDIEHALKALFGEARPGSRWFSKDAA